MTDDPEAPGPSEENAKADVTKVSLGEANAEIVYVKDITGVLPTSRQHHI